MKTQTFLRIVTLLLVFITSQAFAAEVRTWTDQRGRTLEGSLVRIDDDEAVILLKAGNEVRVKRSLLSARDNEYLTEYGGATSAIVEGGKVGVPEKSTRIDTGSFEKLDDVFVFPDTEYDFEMLQSEHFITMTDGSIRPKDIAETAERLWAGMAFQHPTFKEKWGDKRRAIFVIEEEDIHKAVGEYYQNFLADNGEDEAAMRLAITWPKSSGSQITLAPEIADQHGLFQSARVFKVSDDNKQSYRDVFTPFVTHCVAQDMLRTQIGGVSSFGGKGLFSLTTGHAYYKEIQLAGRSGTSLISTTNDSSETSSARGFADGTGWAKELKRLVKRDKVTPSIAEVYGYDANTLTAEQLVLLYSLSYYMQSTPQRLAAYTKMVERIDTSRQVPEAVEMAKLFGFETAEELEANWKEFIESSAFK